MTLFKEEKTKELKHLLKTLELFDQKLQEFIATSNSQTAQLRTMINILNSIEKRLN